MMLKDELKNNEAVRLKDEDLEQVTGGITITGEEARDVDRVIFPFDILEETITGEEVRNVDRDTSKIFDGMVKPG